MERWTEFPLMYSENEEKLKDQDYVTVRSGQRTLDTMSNMTQKGNNNCSDVTKLLGEVTRSSNV